MRTLSISLGDTRFLSMSLPSPGGPATPRSWLRRRRLLATLLALLVTTVLSVAYYLVQHPETWRRRAVLELLHGSAALPPLYSEYSQAEEMLPQHQSKRPFAEGRKYLWVDSNVSWVGWGNVMQDLVMTAHLTYVTGRTYVFDDYVWNRDGIEYSRFNGKLIPSRIPRSALISGPMVGGPFPDGDHTPRAVSKKHWDEICPNPRIVDTKEVYPLHGDGASAVKITETWRDYLADIDDPCVEVSASGSIFHLFMYGNKDQMLPIWPTLSRSPILKQFGWSALAHAAFASNRPLFSPEPLITPYTTTPSCAHCIDPYAPLPGLLAVHLRRGDFVEHCESLGHWGASFNAFASFSSFPDAWVPPEGSDEDRMAVYMRRCLPTIAQVVEKVDAVRAAVGSSEGGLQNVYVMTNADEAWLEELKDALRTSGGWARIATSRDMVWTPEQKYVSQATDMMIGQRAQVFIGNGFSSMSSNIAMLRMAKGMPPQSTRMW